MADIELKEGEAKKIKFAITDPSGVVDVTNATLAFKAKGGGANDVNSIDKEDADFDKTEAGDGIVYLVFDATDTQRAGTYTGELKMVFSTDNIDKSPDISILIKPAVTD